MAYNFTTTSVAVPFVAAFESSLPLLMNSNKQLDKEFKEGTGDTMTMIIPDHPEVTEGAAVAGSLAYQSGSVTLTLTQNNVAINASAVVRALDIHNFDDQVATPYGAKLASKIQKGAAVDIQRKADHQLVFASADLFNEVADAIAVIDDARSYGDKFGIVSPQLSAKIASSGFKFFNPSNQISSIFKKRELGEFQNAMWYTTPDVPALTTGTLTLTGAAVVGTTISAEGSTSLKIDDAGIAGGETIKAGQAFTIDGSEMVDIYGESIGQLVSFVAQADATATAGTITIVVKPIYFVKPMQNVSGTEITAGAAVNQVHEANSRYLGGVIYDKQSFLFGSAKLAPISGTDEKTITAGKALAVKCTKGPDIANGREIVRWDTLTGTQLVRSNWAVAIWLKVA